MTIQERLDDYIDEVLTNTHRHNKYEILAVKRFQKDLKRDWQYHFDISKAESVINFIELLKLTKAKGAGNYFKLQPWQVFFISNIFGWIRPNGLRRFKKGFLDVARKNGKSTLAAALSLYMLLVDDEIGAEVYHLATKEEQAKIVFEEAVRMVEATTLRSAVKKTHKVLYYQPRNAKMQPLGRDSNTLDGSSPSFIVLDEYHAHKNNDLLNVMESGMVYREQAIALIITTAGFNTSYPCYEERQRLKETLETEEDDLRDETYFGMLFTIDDEDDFTIEDNWRKANPNYDLMPEGNIENRVKEALSLPSKQVDVMTKNLNVWTNSDKQWLSMEDWNSCKGVIKDEWFNGNHKIAGGFDLSLRDDLTAYVKVVEVGNKFAIVPKFYMPESVIEDKTYNDKVPYLTWVDNGYIKATPGVVVDYEYVRADICFDNDSHGLTEVAYDNYNARKLVDDLLGDGINMTIFKQNKANFSEPTKEFEMLVKQQRIIHDGNPVLTWMIQNVQLEYDSYGNVQPKKVDRNQRRRKIDGVVATVMAFDRCKASVEHIHNVYEERGVIDIDF